MFFARAHLLNWLVAAVLSAAVSPVLGCGAPSGPATTVEADARFDFRLGDGRGARLAGLVAPAPGLARDFVAARWTGRPLRAAVLAPKPDRWGRWLVDLVDADGASLSDELLRAGLVRVAPEFETRACENSWLSLEARAREDNLGSWDDPDAVLDAKDGAALAVAGPGLVVVEGAVRRVGASRSRFYLDFAGRGGFTVVIARKSETAFRRRGITVAALTGRTIRARGYLDKRFGPRIEIADPAMIELTENVAGPQSGG